MPKSFRELREQSIRLGSGKKYPSRHTATHRRESHISHALTTAPTGEFDKPKKQIQELVGALALGAAAGALGYRAVTRPGGVVDRVKKERLRKQRLQLQIKKSEVRTKDLKDKFSKTSVTKAAVSSRFGNRPLEEAKKLSSAEKLKRNLKRGGFDLEQHEKRNKELADRTAELHAKYAHLLKKEEVANVSGAAVAPLGPSDSDKTAAAIMSKMRAGMKQKMLRRRKPQ